MGLLDNLFHSLDSTLKDIEEGGLERKLDNLASMIDKSTKQAAETTEKIANLPTKVLHSAEEKTAQIEKRVQGIGRQTGKTMDVIRARNN